MSKQVDQASKVLECNLPHTEGHVNKCYNKITAKIKFQGMSSEKERDQRAKKLKEAAEAYRVLLGHAKKGCKCIPVKPPPKPPKVKPKIRPKPKPRPSPRPGPSPTPRPGPRRWNPPPIQPVVPVSTWQSHFWYWLGIGGLGMCILLSVWTLMQAAKKQQYLENFDIGNTAIAIPYETVQEKKNEVPGSKPTRVQQIKQSPTKKQLSSSMMPKTKPTPVSYGYINVETYPWSEVYLEGTNIGNAPFTQPVRVKSGQVKLQLRFHDGKTKTVPVTIR